MPLPQVIPPHQAHAAVARRASAPGPDAKRETGSAGTIYTFYSYKGGVGRSMALANVAALLARWGSRVLVVDWDLEAPGIEHYFERYLPRPGRSKSKRQRGLIDLITDLETGTEGDWRRCCVEAALGDGVPPVTFLTAGRDRKDYVKTVQQLDWAALFADHGLGAYLEKMRGEWAAEFDFVLVDSRTGISDIGGICTILLPDILVLMFTTNEQGLDGSRVVAERARAAQAQLPVDRQKLLVVPVPGRDESQGAYEEVLQWRERFIETFGPFYREWLPKGVEPDRALRKLYIPYWPSWSFGERLPVMEKPDEIDDPRSLSAAFARLATLLRQQLDWTSVESSSYDLQAVEAAEARLRSKESRWRVLRLRAIAAALAVFVALVAVGLWQLDRARKQAADLRSLQVQRLADQAWDLLGGKLGAGVIYRFADDPAILERVRRTIAEAEVIDPDNAMLQNVKGSYLRAVNQPGDAEAAYARAVALDPQSVDFLNNLALALQEQGDLAGAEIAFRRAIDMDPSRSLARFNLGVLLKEMGELTAAAEQIRDAIARNEENPARFRLLGDVLLADDKPLEAVAAYRSAIELEPTSPDLHEKLGQALRVADRESEAVTAFKRADELRGAVAAGG